MQTSLTLQGLLKPFRPVAIAEAVGCSRNAVGAWRLGNAVPDVARLPKLADFLRMDLGELTAVVAADAERIERNRRVA